MKYHFLSTFCACVTLLGVAGTARADISSSIPTNQPNRSDRVSAAASAPTPAMDSLELATYNLVNKYRQSKNLPPLVVDPVISAQAKAHSDKMARSGTMSHDGFNERIDSVAQTIVHRSAAENVAYSMGYGQPELVAIQGWIESPGHQKNMVGRYDLTGIGVSKNAKGEYFFTQIFIRKAWYVKDADTAAERDNDTETASK
jgi:uncharacterized protein YkwD